LTDSLLTRLTTLREEVEAKRAEMKATAQEVVKEGTKAIFAEYGDILEKFGWTQYTPYFNDGEPCNFSMHELVLIEKKADATEGETDDDDDEYYDEDGWPYESVGAFSNYSENSKVSSRYALDKLDARYVACKEACKQVYGALEYGDLARDIFGDHVLVVFTSEGVDVEEHYHE
jgi:hypothetical protein